MLAYPIIIERDGDMLIGTLPDWPECNPVGATVADLIEDAVNSIEEMAMARIEDREPIPVPSDGHPEQVVRLPILTVLKLALYMVMRERGMRKADLARALNVNQKAVDRLFDLNHHSRLDQIEAAYRAMGHSVDVQVLEAA